MLYEEGKGGRSLHSKRSNSLYLKKEESVKNVWREVSDKSLVPESKKNELKWIKPISNIIFHVCLKKGKG